MGTLAAGRRRFRIARIKITHHPGLSDWVDVTAEEVTANYLRAHLFAGHARVGWEPTSSEKANNQILVQKRCHALTAKVWAHD